MDRVYESGASAAPASAPASPSSGYPSGGDPSGGTPATKPGPYWFQMVTESLREVITDAGLTPDHTDTTLLRQAIQALFAGYWGTGSKTAAGYVVLPIKVAGGALEQLIIQWKKGASHSLENTYSEAWPLTWPNACLWANAGTWQSPFDPTADIWYQVIDYTSDLGNVTVAYNDKDTNAAPCSPLLIGIGY